METCQPQGLPDRKAGNPCACMRFEHPGRGHRTCRGATLHPVPLLACRCARTCRSTGNRPAQAGERAGETSKVITVNVQGDTTVELNETFTVTLSNPTNGATLGTPSTATVTIVDDDSVPFLVKDIFPGLSGSSPTPSPNPETSRNS